MRESEVVLRELAALDNALDALGDDAGTYFGVQLTKTSLDARRAALIDELAQSEMAALAVVLEARNVVGAGEIDAGFLADVLAPLQASVAAVAQALDAEPTTRSSIPGAIRTASSLRLRGTFTGSMGLSLTGPGLSQEQLFEVLRPDGAPDIPVFVRAVQRVLRVLESARPSADAGHDDEAVVAELSGLGSRALSHIAALAKTFATNDARARFIFQPPRAAPQTVLISSAGAARLQRILSTIEQDVRDVRLRGRLVGASLVRDRFELAREDGTVVSGTVARETLPFVGGFFDTECTVTLRVERKKSRVDATETESYTMIQIE